MKINDEFFTLCLKPGQRSRGSAKRLPSFPRAPANKNPAATSETNQCIRVKTKSIAEEEDRIGLVVLARRRCDVGLDSADGLVSPRRRAGVDNGSSPTNN